MFMNQNQCNMTKKMNICICTIVEHLQNRCYVHVCKNWLSVLKIACLIFPFLQHMIVQYWSLDLFYSNISVVTMGFLQAIHSPLAVHLKSVFSSGLLVNTYPQNWWISVTCEDKTFKMTLYLIKKCKTSTYHFLTCLSFGGGFLGMRKRALMGCMLHRAAGWQQRFNWWTNRRNEMYKWLRWDHANQVRGC